MELSQAFALLPPPQLHDTQSQSFSYVPSHSPSLYLGPGKDFI